MERTEVVPLHQRLQQVLKAIDADASLLKADRLTERLQALDVLDACFSGPPLPCVGGAALQRRATELVDQLEAINAALYADIRAELQHGHGPKTLLRWVAELTAHRGEPTDGFGYDALDEFVQGVLRLQQPDSQAVLNRPEMVFYQPTPARHIFRLIELSALSPADVLVDIGSGLGHVPLLVAICTPARSVGIEIEASYVSCARQCAKDMGVSNADFMQQDARVADLSVGTVFYLHTPFTGSIMRTVLDRLRDEAAGRSIRICTYGPCTTVVNQETWLRALTQIEADRIAVFVSHT